MELDTLCNLLLFANLDTVKILPQLWKSEKPLGRNRSYTSAVQEHRLGYAEELVCSWKYRKRSNCPGIM